MKKVLVAIDLDELTRKIQDETEWLSTTEGDEIECIGIENLEGILNRLLNVELKLSQG
jgi:hypothetical protein